MTSDRTARLGSRALLPGPLAGRIYWIQFVYSSENRVNAGWEFSPHPEVRCDPGLDRGSLEGRGRFSVRAAILRGPLRGRLTMRAELVFPSPRRLVAVRHPEILLQHGRVGRERCAV